MSNSALSHKERAERAALPAAARQTIIKQMFVGHDRFEEATKQVRAFHMPVEGGVHDTGSLFALAGESRAGKTYVLKRYAREFPVEQGETGLMRRVVYVDLPVACNERGFVERIAAALNVGRATKMNTEALFGNILIGFQEQGTELLLLDEVQEALSPQRPAALRGCQGYLRKMLDLGSMNIVAAGLMETYALMEADAQLEGRGLLPHHIVLPYTWENKEDRAGFRLLCDYIDARLPFLEKSGLGSQWCSARLHWVSDGLIGRLKAFVFRAASYALNESAPKIETAHLVRAWDLVKPVGTTFNPFRDDLSGAPRRRTPEQGTATSGATR
ncbi:ATP-binding protein [Enterovirga aerilata]|uniref:AAA family ATPase n=1 Tax=Enterovirga aerilata TaxID=2730920 RepID=A0A849IIS2_9HYPH|nr:ATP-binding protein [Enterovirga sp. DB1703]NNM73843.1 AAA family ATPase [Enterovirga sp. DB1703]